jgi:NADH-quinone oxidoreductase subunit G
MSLVKVTIDNIEVEVEPGTTIMNAARKIGGKVVPPAMCYYSKLEGSGGKCRTCLVKVAQGSAKDPRPMPKLVASCRTVVQDGMVVQNTTSPEVMEARKAITEFLLLNHPYATRRVSVTFRIYHTTTGWPIPRPLKSAELLNRLILATTSNSI